MSRLRSGGNPNAPSRATSSRSVREAGSARESAPTERPALRWRIARPLLVGLARADLSLDRAQSWVRDTLASALPAMLSAAELAELSGRLYEHRGATAREPFAWEREWLVRLPPPPARGLVGGAGYGPECALLLRAGYHVDAYDPSPDAVEACRRLLGEAGRASCGTHEDLLDPSLARGPYDFVWLGWGSLTHVLDPDTRARVIEACARLTSGPIFASGWVTERARAAGRVRRTSDAILTRLGLTPGAAGVLFQPHVGLGALIPRQELSDLAARIGRRLEVPPTTGVAAFAFLP